jgi:hypothetical protein
MTENEDTMTGINVIAYGSTSEPEPSQHDRDKRIAYYSKRARLGLPLFDGMCESRVARFVTILLQGK